MARIPTTMRTPASASRYGRTTEALVMPTLYPKAYRERLSRERSARIRPCPARPGPALRATADAVRGRDRARGDPLRVPVERGCRPRPPHRVRPVGGAEPPP